MTSITRLLDAADLIQAVYSNLTAGPIAFDQLLRSAANPSEQNMPLAQAEAFARRYEVLRVFDDTTTGTTGTYAVLFRDRSTSRVTMAVRGTDGAGDWFNANSHLIIGIPPALNVQFAALQPVVSQWIREGAIPAGSTIVGHSLGGYLAAALKAANPATFTTAATVNAPGFVPALGPILQVLQQIYGIPVPQEGVVDVRGTAGLSLIAGLGNHLGTRAAVEIEAAPFPFIGNHSVANVARSLSLLDLWSQLDPTLTLPQGNGLLNATSNSTTGMLERGVEAIRHLVNGPRSPALGDDDHQALYAAVDALRGVDANGLPKSPAFASLAGKVTLRPIGANLATQAQARVDFQSFVALQTLSPFVVDPVGTSGEVALQALWQSPAWATTHSMWQQDKADVTAGHEPPNFSDRWLADRAALVSKLAERNARNLDPTAAATSVHVGRNILFLDLDSNQRVAAGALPSAATVYDVIAFGKSTEDLAGELTGHDRGNDALYGMAGNDTVIGLGGNDHLEGNSGNDSLSGGAGADTLIGGTGNDTLEGGADNDHLRGGAGTDVYRFAPGSGFDTIDDADGAGRIEVAGIGTLTGAGVVRVGDGVWRSADGRVTYSLVGGAGTAAPGGLQDLQVRFTSGSITGADSDGLVIKGWAVPRTGLHSTQLARDAQGQLVWSAYERVGTDTLIGGAGHDSITIYHRGEVLGGDGTDTIGVHDGSLGNVDAGTGNDTVDIIRSSSGTVFSSAAVVRFG